MRDVQVRHANGTHRHAPRQNEFAFFSDFDRMFDGLARSFVAPVLGSDYRPAFQQDNRTESRFVPPYEFNETEQGYLLSFDVPGISKDEIKIEVKESELRISGERKQLESSTQGTRAFSGRRYGQFELSFSLPKDVDVENIEAHHENGVLELMLPKAAKAQPRTIKIGSGEGFFSKLVGNKSE